MFLGPNRMELTPHSLLTTETASDFKVRNLGGRGWFGKYSQHFCEILSFLVTASPTKTSSLECLWEAKTTMNCSGINLEQFKMHIYEYFFSVSIQF